LNTFRSSRQAFPGRPPEVTPVLVVVNVSRPRWLRRAETSDRAYYAGLGSAYPNRMCLRKQRRRWRS
jgi:hypothetical protein